MARRYQKKQALLSEIQQMLGSGMSQREIEAALGLEGRRPIHALRHTLATRLVEEHVPLNIVQGILGHASIETTRKYLHKNTDLEREAIEKMSDYLDICKFSDAPKLNGARPRGKFVDIILPVFPAKKSEQVTLY